MCYIHKQPYSYVTGSEKTCLNGMFYISRNAMFSSGVTRLVSWWGIARPTDCIIRVFDCSVRVY